MDIQFCRFGRFVGDEAAILERQIAFIQMLDELASIAGFVQWTEAFDAVFGILASASAANAW